MLPANCRLPRASLQPCIAKALNCIGPDGTGPDGTGPQLLFCDNDTNAERLWGLAHGIDEGVKQASKQTRGQAISNELRSDQRSARSTARTGEASAVVSLSGSAISS